MNGIIYCRVSSKEQAEGTSLESQELACREFARSKDIKVLKVFVERGESAKFADRTQLLELIDFCLQNKGTVQVLLVWKVDRFARNVGDHFNIKATLLKYGVRIVSVTEPIDSNPEGKLMETILAGFAQFDNDIRATRTVQGMKRKLQEGIFPWKAPLGYASSTRNGERKTEPDAPDQPIFSLLQRTFREFATGAYTKAEIGRLMTNWGVLTRRGKPLSAQSVDNLFKNPYYAGVLVDPWSGEEYEARHIPLVSHSEFVQIQQIVKRRSRAVPHRKERAEFPLRGLVRCSCCLRYMTGSFSRGRSRRYAYYHCHNRQCDIRGRSYPTGAVHDEFQRFLDKIAPQVELMEKLGALVVQVADGRREFLKTKKARVEVELARLKRQIQELIGIRTDGLITNAEFLAQKKLLTERRIALEDSPAPDSFSVQEIREQLNQIMGPMSRLREAWASLSLQFRRRFERLILPVGFVNGKIGTAKLGLLFRIFGDLSEGNSTAGSLVGKSWNQIIREITEFSDLIRAYHNPEGPSREAVQTTSRE